MSALSVGRADAVLCVPRCQQVSWVGSCEGFMQVLREAAEPSKILADRFSASQKQHDVRASVALWSNLRILTGRSASWPARHEMRLDSPSQLEAVAPRSRGPEGMAFQHFCFATTPFTMPSSVTTTHLDQQSDATAVKAEVREAVEEAIEHTLSSPELSAQVAADIRHLGQMVKTIRRGFRVVADDLVRFDDKEYKDKDGKVLRLRPLWLGYSETFDDILERSHRNALAASSMIRQYTEAVLTDVDPSEFEDIREELKGFLKKLDEKEPAARQTEGDLTKLAKNVRSFKAVVDHTLCKAEGECVNDANKAKGHLEALDQNLQSINEEKTELGHRALQGFSLLCGASALVAIFVLAPNSEKVFLDAISQIGMVFGVPAVALAGYCGLQGWLLHRQGTNCETEMEECRANISRKGARHRELLGHKAAMVHTKEQITALAKKVDAITSIWKVLKCDMQLLQDGLADLVNPDVRVTKRFLKRLRGPREVFNRLADLLELYAKGNFE